MKKYIQSHWGGGSLQIYPFKMKFRRQNVQKIVVIIAFFLIHLSSSAQVSLVQSNPVGFSAYDALDNKIVMNSNGTLWSSDGTTNGTFQIPSVPILPLGYSSTYQCRVGNSIYYSAGGLSELWKTDGTIAGTVKVIDGLSRCSNLVNLNGLLIFTTSPTSTGTELWRSDGTAAGTYMITDLAGTSDGVTSTLLKTAVYNGYLYFSGLSVTISGTQYANQPTVWRTDGTAGGTSQVSNAGYSPQGFNVINNKLIYRAYTLYTPTCNGQPAPQLINVIMKIDGSTASIVKESAIVSYCSQQLPLGNTFLNTTQFIKSGNYLYFRGQTEVVGGYNAYNLWRTDGTTTGTIQLTDFLSNSTNVGLENFYWQSGGSYNFGNIFFCSIRTDDNGVELWRSDGTIAGTFMIKDILAGTGDSNPKEFRTVNGLTYFFSRSVTNGNMELWQSDGSSDGTTKVDGTNQVIGYTYESMPVANNQGTLNNNFYGISMGNNYFFSGKLNNGAVGLYSTCISPVPTLSTSSLQICAGTNATLSASGCGGTINWSTGASGSNIIVSPNINSTYTATCTENDCQVSLTASIDITVNPTPTISVNNQTICSGNNTTLTASSCTGNITWNTGASGSILTLNNITTTTTYTATCTLNGCTATNTGTVTVNPTPTVSVNNQNICTGSNTTLTASNCIGTVSWNTGASGSVLTLNNVTTTTTYTATCTLGSCTATNTGTVTVNQTLSVSVNNQTICSGSNTSLTASNCAGNVTWKTGASGSVLTLTNITANATYTATCTLGDCIASNTGTVTVNPVPTVSVNSQTICSGSNTTLTASTCTGNVTWNTGASGSVLSLTNISTTTTYTATCTLGSCTKTNTGTVTVNPTPTVSVNSQTICSGGNTTLTASTCAGNVTWNTGASGSVLSLTNISTTTTYTATCTLGSCTKTNTGTVTVNSTPTVSVNSQTICSGTNTVLTASTCLGTITWNTGVSSSVLNLTNITTTTNYTATCTIGSCTASSIGTVTVNQSPTVNTITAQQFYAGNNTPVISFSGSNPNAIYTWTNDNPSIGLAASGTGNIPTFVAVNSGVNPQVANITVTPSTSSPNCSGTSKTFTITVIRAASGTITQMEYFIDDDLGYGNGTAVSFTAGNPVTVNFTVSLSASSDGFHFLTLRAKDADNNWGIVAIRPFYKETIPTASLSNITAMEYFIDNDLGYGLCTPVAGLTSSTSVSQSFQIPLNNTLSDGFHFLTLRAKDTNNNWSIVAVRPFYKETITSASIAQMEYFIDNDPGTNNGTNVNIMGNSLIASDNKTLTSFSANVSFAFLPSNISNGTHKLSIRVRDTNNNWGIVQIKEFTVQDNLIVVNNAPPQWCANTPFNIPFTITGTYTSGNIFTAQLSDINGSFTNPISIGVLTATTAGTIAANIPNGTTLSDNYQIRVISSTPSITNTEGKLFKVVSICPPPCEGLISLLHLANDILSGNITKQASAFNGSISASNYVQGSGTRATYQARSITLTAGFRADSGVVFKAETGGCN